MAKRDRAKRAASSAGYFVVGRNACREILRHRPERVKRVCVAEENDRSSCADIYSLAKQVGKEVASCSKDELTELCDTSSHQGFVVEAVAPERQNLKEFLSSLSNGRVTCIALDSVTDPHNVGAILRAAECFGIDAVIIPGDRSGDITPVVTKVSVGASELVPVIRVKNLVKAIKDCRDSGFWAIAAGVSDRAEALQGFAFPERSIIVLGAEGGGIRRLVLETCDFEVFIPMLGEVDSLNVSQAAAVMMYQRSAESSN